MVYAYLRVSTGKQDGQNQRVGVEALATARGLKIDEYIDDEGVSGTKEPEKRELGRLLEKLKPGDVLLAGEISRLGRSLFMVFRILEHCLNNNVTVMTAKDGYTLGNDIQSKVLAFAFGISAEIEREMISRRTKEALQRKRADGVVLGRPKGRKTSPECHKLYGKDEEIKRYLVDEGLAQRKVCKMMGVDRNTLARFIDNSEVLSRAKPLFRHQPHGGAGRH